MLTPESRLTSFPSLDGVTYFNTSAEGIPPRSVQSALQTYFADKARGMSGRDAQFAELEACRAAAGRLLNRPAEDIAICSSTSEAYNLFASALCLGPEDEVVITDLDFPAGATPWIQGGSRTRLWKNRDGVLPLETLEALLSERTKLVQVSLVSFLNGYRIPWEEFQSLTRRCAPNAILSVDVTQAFGRVELDCLDADILFASGYKWLLGSHGSCVVAVKESEASRLTPSVGGWHNLENAFEADRFERAVPKPGAAGFMVGMPNFPGVYALRAGMEFVEQVGVSEIARHADPLVEVVDHGLRDLGIQPMAPVSGSGIVSFQHPDAARLDAALLERNIHIMHQAGRLRISIHGYNQLSEVESLLCAISEIC